MLELLRKVSSAHGVSGFEKKAAEVMRGLIADYTDEQYTDALGNLIAVKHGNGQGKKIMLCAHMDEIGFMVTFIEEKGQLCVAPVGGISFVASSYDRVMSEKGVRGLIVPRGGVKPADYSADKFYIDIGANNRKEAEKKVKVGDVFRFEADVVRLCGKRVCGHPLDDRIGCAILVEIAKSLANEKINDDIYYVFSVQEEVGLRGSKTAAYAIAPDLSLAYDVTGTGDVPGASPMACALGDGAAIKVKDSSVICDPTLVEELVETAKKEKIKYQLEILNYGGTDTASMQMARAGSRACALSVPSRYIHSGNEMLDLDDAIACVDLTVAYIKSIN